MCEHQCVDKYALFIFELCSVLLHFLSWWRVEQRKELEQSKGRVKRGWMDNGEIYFLIRNLCWISHLLTPRHSTFGFDLLIKVASISRIVEIITIFIWSKDESFYFPSRRRELLLERQERVWNGRGIATPWSGVKSVACTVLSINIDHSSVTVRDAIIVCTVAVPVCGSAA